MKQIKLLLFTFLLIGSAVGFNSCDDDSGDQDPNIVGTWTVDSIQWTVEQTSDDGNASGTMTFNADKTGSRDYSFSAVGNPFTISNTFTWDDSNSETLLITTSNGGVETWTRTVDTASSQEMTVIMTLDTFATTMDFTLSK